MIKKLFSLTFFIYIYTVAIYPQSLETQLKIIFGDYLSLNQNKNLRTIGRGLSSSGQMQYEFEKIHAESEKTVNYNINNSNEGSSITSSNLSDYFIKKYTKLPENIIIDNNIIKPKDGYEWMSPDDLEDFKVKPISPYSLKTYNYSELKNKFNSWSNVNVINCIFTCKWHKDFNNNGYFEFDEFKHIKNHFSKDEDFEIIFRYIVSTKTEYTLKTSVFDDYTGNLLATNEIVKSNSSGGYSHIEIIPKSTLPPGIYMITAEILLRDNKGYSNTISERIEILP